MLFQIVSVLESIKLNTHYLTLLYFTLHLSLFVIVCLLSLSSLPQTPTWRFSSPPDCDYQLSSSVLAAACCSSSASKETEHQTRPDNTPTKRSVGKISPFFFLLLLLLLPFSLLCFFYLIYFYWVSELVTVGTFDVWFPLWLFSFVVIGVEDVIWLGYELSDFFFFWGFDRL